MLFVPERKNTTYVLYLSLSLLYIDMLNGVMIMMIKLYIYYTIIIIMRGNERGLIIHLTLYRNDNNYDNNEEEEEVYVYTTRKTEEGMIILLCGIEDNRTVLTSLIIY